MQDIRLSDFAGQDQFLYITQFGHKRCRYRLDMGEQTSPRRYVFILVTFFLQAI